jgi:signal transduction histidine kinase
VENVDQAIRSFERLGDWNEQPGSRKADARVPQARKAEAAATSLDVAAIGEDTTERHRLDDELRHAQKLEAISTFAGGVAKDFNDILTVILGYADLFLTELKPSDPMRSYAEEVRIAGERAARLTQQLLVFSRTQVIAPEVSDMNSRYSRIGEDAATADK